MPRVLFVLLVLTVGFSQPPTRSVATGQEWTRFRGPNGSGVSDAKTGKSIWTGRVRGKYFGSPICVNGKLYCADVDGEIVVVDAADTFQQLARNPVGEQIRSTPAVSGGTMFIRSDGHVYAIGQ